MNVDESKKLNPKKSSMFYKPKDSILSFSVVSVVIALVVAKEVMFNVTHYYSYFYWSSVLQANHFKQRVHCVQLGSWYQHLQNSQLMTEK